ncbi:acetate--CoA ligase alpha subunit [Candidatus Bipolaricaulota sp. J31]
MGLEGLLYPRSVALIGASPKEGKLGNVLFKNMASFPGRFYPVNPNYGEIGGVKCYPSVSALPEVPDMAVVIIPAEPALGVIEECGRVGIENVVVITAGFKESGPEGAMREKRLVEIAKRYGLNVLGPNCFGLISTEAGLNATFAVRGALPGNIAFLSQSGAFCTSVLDWAWKEKLGFSHFVSLGNKAVLNEAHFLRPFAEDPDTKVIVAYLEGISDGEAFIRIAREVVKTTPIVVLKAGRTEAGARAVSSHTGTLAGSDAAYEAAFKKCGVIRARNVEELFDYAYALAKQPTPRGRRVGVMTNAGGAGVMASDAVEEYGLELARFSEETAIELGKFLPPAANIYNPVDVLGDAHPDRYKKALDLVANDPNVDMVVALSAPAPLIPFSELARIVSEAKAGSGKPLTVSFMAGELGEEAEEVLREAGISSYFDPSRAVRALAVLRRYAEIKGKEWEEPRELPADRERVRELFSRALAAGKTQLGVEAMEVLEAYGIPVAPWGLARTPEEAKGIAERVGDPVVLKLVSPDLIHKTEVGGVVLGVPAREVGERAEEMLTRASSRFPHARIEGVLVQRQMPPGQELILGSTRDPQFGPLAMVGVGGIFVEVLQDVAFGIAPLSPGEAREMVESLRGYALLRGVRGRPGVDVEAVVAALERVSRLVHDFPEIVELDVNPLLAYPDGVVAVDLRITLSKGER